MCGMVGVFGNLVQPDIKYFKNALVADWVRGVHSTGIAVVDAVDEVFVKKAALNPCDFLDLKSVSEEICISAQCLMGHNRQATVGSVNAANAHPFQHGAITLMHNGTLTNKFELTKKYDAPSFGTDSELVCWLIDNYVLDQVIKDLEGAFALVWWDSEEKSLNFISNGERDFNVLVREDKILWASEAKMLDWIADRAGILKKTDVIYEPKVGRHLRLQYIKNKLEIEYEDLELAEKKTYTRTGTTIQGNSTGGTTSNTLAPYVSNVVQFKKDYSIDVSYGKKIYAYISDVVDSQVASQSPMCNLHCTLAVEPYCNVKVYYTNKLPMYRRDAYGVLLTVKSVRMVGDKYEIICEASPHSIEMVNDEVSQKRMDNWIDENSVPFVPSDIDSSVLFEGYEGEMLSWEEFQDCVETGCSWCGTVDDAHNEADNRTVVFISPKEILCEDCATDPTVDVYIKSLTCNNAQAL